MALLWLTLALLWLAATGWLLALAGWLSGWVWLTGSGWLAGPGLARRPWVTRCNHNFGPRGPLGDLYDKNTFGLYFYPLKIVVWYEVLAPEQK